MSALVVVEPVGPVDDDGPGLGPGVELVPGQDFPLQGREERLGGGVVEARADPAHRLADPEVGAEPGERGRRVGRAPVGVEDDAVGLVLAPDRLLAAASGDGHPDRRARQVSVGVGAGRGAEQPARVQVDHGGQVQLALGRGDLGDVADPLVVGRRRGEVATHQVQELGCGPVLPGQAAAALDHAGHQALTAHRLGDRLLADPPSGLAQVLAQAGRSVQALRLAERDGHGPVDGVAPPVGVGEQPARGARAVRALDPLVEPRLGDSEQRADGRVWHGVVGPLVGDEACHAHFVASFTHRTTDRLRTSRSIRSSATSARSRFSSS